MIIYFSGTGNSRYVAQALARQLNDKAVSIEDAELTLKLSSYESLGLVFPVYAWGLPHIFATFIRQRLTELRGTTNYLWSVMTCGDDVGFADRLLQRELQEAMGRSFDAVFSVQVTETYVCLPGFDIDTPEVAQQKVTKTDAALAEYADLILQHRSVERLVRGPIPHIYHYVLRPFFNRWLVTDRHFHVDADRCTHCGRCARECPAHDIRLVDGLPTWPEDSCTMCLRCFHHCPARAIDWGRFTKDKGQKVIPNA